MTQSKNKSENVSRLAWNLVVIVSFVLLVYLPAEDALMQETAARLNSLQFEF